MGVDTKCDFCSSEGEKPQTDNEQKKVGIKTSRSFFKLRMTL